jgi:DNA primase
LGEDVGVKYITKQDVLNNISIIKIADEFGIKLSPAFSGNFDLRCRCPSQEHKSGNERTESLYIDSQENNFYCFGCSSGSSVIDFYMSCADLDFKSAMADLRKRVDPKKAKGGRFVQKNNNFSILLDISSMFRETMLSNPRDLKWISTIMKRSDDYIVDIDSSDIKKAKQLKDKINSVLKDRYSK